MGLNLKRISKETLIFIFITFLLFAIVELFSFLIYSLHSENNKPGEFQFRASQPDAYKNSPYFTKNFLSNLYGSSGIFFTPNGTRDIRIKDYSTEFINVNDGNRATTSILGGAPYKIYFFGGSTMFSGEVPDYYTIPSLFSHLLYTNNIINYEVINKGVTSVNISQQLEYLQKTKLSKGDIVVFYDGVNDILQGLYFGHPEGTIIGDQRKIKYSNESDTSLMALLGNSFLKNLYTYKVIFQYAKPEYFPDHLLNNSQLDTLNVRVKDQYLATIKDANLLTNSKGAKFYHFLQPNIFDLPKKSTYEDDLTRNHVFPAIDKAFNVGSPGLKEANANAIRAGISAYDLSSALNNKTEECFLDGYHITEICNALVASKIFSTIFPKETKGLSLSRRELNTIHDDYLVNKNLKYLTKDFTPQNKKIIFEIDNFGKYDFFGKFEKNDVSIGILIDGFISTKIPTSELMEIDIEASCPESNQMYVALNHEIDKNHPELNISNRFPLECGKTKIYYRLPKTVAESGILIENPSKTQKLKIKSLKIFSIN